MQAMTDMMDYAVSLLVRLRVEITRSHCFHAVASVSLLVRLRVEISKACVSQGLVASQPPREAAS